MKPILYEERHIKEEHLGDYDDSWQLIVSFHEQVGTYKNGAYCMGVNQGHHRATYDKGLIHLYSGISSRSLRKAHSLNEGSMPTTDDPTIIDLLDNLLLKPDQIDKGIPMKVVKDERMVGGKEWVAFDKNE
jgi:hypothetical protein|tara:strand:- start:156 stop:548 length:393 start_codon:yes stop_codon:yes gene_type:complete